MPSHVPGKEFGILLCLHGTTTMNIFYNNLHIIFICTVSLCMLVQYVQQQQLCLKYKIIYNFFLIIVKDHINYRYY